MSQSLTPLKIQQRHSRPAVLHPQSLQRVSVIMARLHIPLQIAALILALWLPLAQPAAAEGILVTESKASHSFAQQVTFTLQANSDAEISQVYLFFRATGSERTKHKRIDIEPASEIKVDYVHDLRISPLPPFATVTFWWLIEDTAGNSLDTKSQPQQFQYIDNRFTWKSLDADGVAVHWIENQGDPVFGQTALDIARSTREQLAIELDIQSPRPINIYIYDTQSNLDAAMTLTGQDWVRGQAHPDLGVILIAIPNTENYASHMMRYIPHEITHLLVYQAVTPAGYQYVPEWLDEGLATATERLPTPEHTTVLEEAYTEGQLIPLKDLCIPFSPDPYTAFLSYAQSGSLVRFVREEYGAVGIRALLAAYAKGASCTGGVQEALNISLNALETAWRSSLEQKAPWRAWLDQIDIWVGLWLLSLLVTVPMVGRLRRRHTS